MTYREMYLLGYSIADAARQTGHHFFGVKYRIAKGLPLDLPDRFEELLPREKFILFVKAHGLKRVDVMRYFGLTFYQYDSFRRRGVNFERLKREIENIKTQ